MTFNTGNPVPSTDARDLYDNATNLDKATNGTDPTWTDRLGVTRKSWAGMEQEFLQFLADSGFEMPPLAYVDGAALQVLRATQVIQRNDQLYRIQLPATFPVVLSGTWAGDQLKLTPMSDHSLRQELANGTAFLVDGSVTYGLVRPVSSVSGMTAVAGRYDGDTVWLSGYYSSLPGMGSGAFRWDAASTAAHNGGTVIEAEGVVTGRWVRQGVGSKIYADWFGVRPSPANDTALTQAAINACSLQHPGCNFVFRNGIYVFGPAVDNRAIISLPAGVYPETENATITVADGLVTSTARFEGVFVQLDFAYDLGDFKSARLDFDLNGQNNLIPQGAHSGTKGAGLVIRRARSVEIGVYRVRNVSGRQCLMLGDTPGYVGHAEVGVFEAEGVGAGIPTNQYQTDHSCVFAICKSLHIGHANGVNEALSSSTVTLVESHADDTIIGSWRAINFQIAHIAAAIVKTVNSYHIGPGDGKGDILLGPWTGSGFTIGTVTIDDQVTFERSGGVYPLIDMDSKNLVSIDRIDIGRIKVKDTHPSPTGAAPAFILGRVKVTRLGACDIDGATGRLLQNGTILDGVSELYVEGARARNLNKVNNASYPQAIRLFGTGVFAVVDIQNMRIGAAAGAQTIGVQVECPVGRLRLYDNEMSSGYTTPYSTASSTTTNCYIRHKGAVAPSASGVRANAGSQWLVIGGAQYVTTADGTTWTNKAY